MLVSGRVFFFLDDHLIEFLMGVSFDRQPHFSVHENRKTPHKDNCSFQKFPTKNKRAYKHQKKQTTNIISEGERMKQSPDVDPVRNCRLVTFVLELV